MYINTNGLEFLKSLPKNSIDGIFTDPPWGRGPKMAGQDNWLGLIRDMTDECPRICRPGARVLIWVGMRMMGQVIRAINSVEFQWAIFCYYIPPRYIAGFESVVDPILFFARPGDPLPMRPRKIRQIYQKANMGMKDTRHPAARPFATVKSILLDWFDPGEYVVDPFAGSDTTGVACRQLSLEYDSCEIDPIMFAHGLERNRQGYLFEEKNEAIKLKRRRKFWDDKI